MPKTDNRLIIRVFKEYEDELRLYLIKKAGSVEEAEDITQEAFLKLHLAKAPEDIRHPKAFLFRVATNILIDHIRRRRSRVKEVFDDGLVNNIPDDGFSPETSLHSRDFRRALEKAISELSPRRRQVVVMHKILEKSYGEIAEELGITRSMVEQHMTRALRHCRKRLQHLR